MSAAITRRKLFRLIRDGAIQHQPDAVRLPGISRQRVSGILQEEAIKLPRPSAKTEYLNILDETLGAPIDASAGHVKAGRFHLGERLDAKS